MTSEVVPYESRRSRGNTNHRFDDVAKTQYVDLLRQGYGRIRSAEMVGFDVRTVRKGMEDDPDFHAKVRMAEGIRVDEVESAMYETAIAGHFSAQKFIMVNRRRDEWVDLPALRAAAEREVLEAANEEEDDDGNRAITQSRVEELRASMINTRRELLEERASDDDSEE